MDDTSKTRGIKQPNFKTWLLFAPPIKIPGYVPENDNTVFHRILQYQAVLCGCELFVSER